ncbi:hypothetical protein JQK88_33975 [Mesorhizobium caraganae]|uniref:hypothetical protein n=1 Tax=Mesorhizobium caraganae TaxID=483206 RepID=UPI001939B7FF|nr:hypothetical protein [Mesorhizobium caraganae]
MNARWVAAGETVRAVAAALRISPSCVSKWSGRATGSVSPGKIGGHTPRVLSVRMPTGCAGGCPRVLSRCGGWWRNWPSVV